MYWHVDLDVNKSYSKFVHLLLTDSNVLCTLLVFIVVEFYLMVCDKPRYYSASNYSIRTYLGANYFQLSIFVSQTGGFFWSHWDFSHFMEYWWSRHRLIAWNWLCAHWHFFPSACCVTLSPIWTRRSPGFFGLTFPSLLTSYTG